MQYNFMNNLHVDYLSKINYLDGKYLKIMVLNEASEVFTVTVSAASEILDITSASAEIEILENSTHSSDKYSLVSHASDAFEEELKSFIVSGTSIASELDYRVKVQEAKKVVLDNIGAKAYDQFAESKELIALIDMAYSGTTEFDPSLKNLSNTSEYNYALARARARAKAWLAIRYGAEYLEENLVNNLHVNLQKVA